MGAEKRVVEVAVIMISICGSDPRPEQQRGAFFLRLPHFLLRVQLEGRRSHFVCENAISNERLGAQKRFTE